MPSNDPPAPNDTAHGAPDGPTAAPDGPPSAPDALRDLQQRLDRASEAAERLITEARGTPGEAATEPGEPSLADADKPPPAGWQTLGGDAPAAEGRELELLAQVIRSLRELLPAELERRLAEALRELLLAFRALIDFYLERLERREAPEQEPRDIPIS